MTEIPKLTEEGVIELLRRAELDPADWNVTAILRRTNAWISDYDAELTDPDVATWSTADQVEHYAEFGSLAAVDFFEQCVIEASSATAPWPALAARADAGDFDNWPPVWEALKPRHLRGR